MTSFQSPEAAIVAAGGTTEHYRPADRFNGTDPNRRPPGPHAVVLPVLTPADCDLVSPRPYIVKGILGRGDSAVLIAPPGGGKSVLAPHVGYAVAQGRSIFGRRVRQGRVLYLAAEDGHGMKVRVRALRARWGDAPDFRLVPVAVDLRDPHSKQLVAVGTLIEELQPALVIVDTLVRAFPGLRENEPDAPEGMGRVVQVARNFTAICESAVLVLHHPPQGEPRARGHGSLNADADLAMFISGEKAQPRSVSFSKNRNGTSDQTLTFSIRVETLGEDEDGDPITGAIADEIEATPSDGNRAKEAKLRDKPATMLRQLRSEIAGHGEPVEPEIGSPLVTAISRSAFRKHLIASGWFPDDLLRTAPSGVVEMLRGAYRPENHALETLKRAGFLSFNREWVWPL